MHQLGVDRVKGTVFQQNPVFWVDVVAVVGCAGNESLSGSCLQFNIAVKHVTVGQPLTLVSQIEIDQDFIANSKHTTVEVKECCKDIKVLGRKEIR